MIKFAGRVRRLLPHFLIGLAVVAAIIAIFLYVQRGAYMQLRGSVQKVRTLALPDGATVALLELRLENPADYNYVVRRTEVLLETVEGQTAEGSIIPETDLDKIFEFYPIIGQRYNPSLRPRTQIAPHHTLERMLGARFEVSEETFQRRAGLLVRIEELDGAVSEIREQPAR